ncbi:DUF7147 family protein [Halalkalibacterium ligniniphilum]|uniref:DUF7147 family protein n=1 Tax=Halalkalibacterium ligniniphilum TaxID=1134413 RepID=UPI00034CB16E|nr:hypothetical protein [Halalkalibacterium ligniniphilum]
MIQRFIELGEGYSDLFELLELAKTNQHRLHMLLRLDTTINNRKMTSLAVILKPAESGKLMPLYLCREGIPNPDETPNQRYELFDSFAKELKHEVHTLVVKSSNDFNEPALYYQYLIGVLRMNRYIPPLS